MNSTSPSNNTLLATLVAFGLIAIYLAQVWGSMVDKSATYDEQVYVLAGYGYLETGEYCLKQDAPPLIPLLSAGAIKVSQWLGTEVELDDELKEMLPQIREDWHARSFDSVQEYPLASEFFHRNNGPRLIQIARIPIGLLGALLGLFLFRFVKLLFGPMAALAALTLFVLDPNMVGHGRVVSADLALTCFFLISHYYLYRCLTEKSSGLLVSLSVSVALCVSVKLSGLLVFPSLALITFVAVVRPPAEWLRAREVDKRQFSQRILLRAGLGALFALLATWICLSAIYLSPAGPLAYYDATKLIYSNVEQPYKSFLMGVFQTRYWYYYFFALFFKTPLSTIVLFGLSLFWGRSEVPFSRLFVWAPLLVIFGVSCLDGINIGVRRVLVAFPFLWLSIGSLFFAAIESGTESKGRWVIRSLATAGLAWSIWVAVSCFPNSLTFFNYAVGGPGSGHRYLAESNVSWGQNLPALSRYLKAEGIDEVRMHFYGFDNRADYGINDIGFNDFQVYWPLQDVYVLSVHSMIQFSQNEDLGSDWFERFEPKAVIGETLYVFDLRNYPQEMNRSPEASLELARRMVNNKKYGASVVNFQAYLLAHPEDADVHRELANVAEKFKHMVMADVHLRRAEALTKEQAEGQ